MNKIAPDDNRCFHASHEIELSLHHQLVGQLTGMRVSICCHEIGSIKMDILFICSTYSEYL